jgi:hypothetical protein
LRQGLGIDADGRGFAFAAKLLSLLLAFSPNDRTGPVGLSPDDIGLFLTLSAEQGGFSLALCPHPVEYTLLYLLRQVGPLGANIHDLNAKFRRLFGGGLSDPFLDIFAFLGNNIPKSNGCQFLS